MKSNISVVINVVDAEVPLLEEALQSVYGFASEIVLIDMTILNQKILKELAKKYKMVVYTHKLVPYVEPVRNFGISKAQGKWILILDPDERINKKLAKKLIKISQNDECDYLNIPRKNIIFNKWIKYSRWWPDYNVRFFKKDKVEWGKKIHSIPVTNGVGKDLLPKERNAIEHWHYSSIEQFIERMNRYTTQQAQNMFDEGKKFAWYMVVTKPSQEFNSRFFMGKGYKDGLHGLVLCSLQSFSEMVSIVKLWQLEKFYEKSLSPLDFASTFRKIKKDQNYWISEMLVTSSNKIKFLERLRRKYKI